MVLLGLLFVSAVLSRLAFIGTAALLAVDLVALVVRAALREPVAGWGAVAVASLVLTLVFEGVSIAVYGPNFVVGCP